VGGLLSEIFPASNRGVHLREQLRSAGHDKTTSDRAASHGYFRREDLSSMNEEALEAARELVLRDPSRAAQAIRHWLREDDMARKKSLNPPAANHSRATLENAGSLAPRTLPRGFRYLVEPGPGWQRYALTPFGSVVLIL